MNNSYPGTKKVNIYPQRPIVTLNPPIRSSVRRVYKSAEEIRKCLIARGIVEEVMEDGSTVRLDFSNYDKDNHKTTKEADAEAARLRAEKAEKERKEREAAEAKRIADEKAAAEKAEAERKRAEEIARKQQEEAAKVKTENIEDACQQPKPYTKPNDNNNNQNNNQQHNNQQNGNKK